MSEELNNNIGIKVIAWEYDNLNDIGRITVEVDTRKLSMQQAEEIIRNNVAEAVIKRMKRIEKVILRGKQ